MVNILKPKPLFRGPDPSAPTRMTDEEKELYQRIADAGSAEAAGVTRAVRNKVHHRPPPEEEDRLCMDEVGLTVPALRAKAVASPHSLTETECAILWRGADRNSPGWWSPSWLYNLPPGERALAERVWEIVEDAQAREAERIAADRDRAEFAAQRSARVTEALQRRREEARREMDRARRANTPRWANEMRDARLRRWGFVVFRTAYGGGTDVLWDYFQRVHRVTGSRQLRECWKKSGFLRDTQDSVWVGGDPSLDRADVGALRTRFRAMRERGEVPEGIATDCFLVVDEAILSHPIVASRLYCRLKSLEDPDTEERTVYVRAVDPDHVDSTPVPIEGDLAGFTGEISVPLPKIFDWLYYCSFAKSEDWEMRYKATKSGPAELMKVRSLFLKRTSRASIYALTAIIYPRMFNHS